MKKPCVLLLTLIMGMLAPVTARADDASPRKIISLDADWRFTLGDPPGAEKPDFDDSSWRKLDVPHDWSIEGAIDPRNPSGTAQAFLPMGVGWYRKALPPLSGAINTIEFDGVMSNATVYLNGRGLASDPTVIPRSDIF